MSFCRAVETTIPIKTTNPNNGAQGISRGAMFARAKRRKEQRHTACVYVMSLRPLPPLPVIITVTRLAPSNGLDPHDGLGASLKGVCDGITDALGLANDRDPRIKWKLTQERSAKGVYGVRVRIESGAELESAAVTRLA